MVKQYFIQIKIMGLFGIYNIYFYNIHRRYFF